MFKNYKIWLKAVTLAFVLGYSTQMFAQNVIFPQQEQPGVACSSQSGDMFTLSNHLLCATFTRQGDQLLFGGCEALDLLPNKNIFKIQVDNGKEVPSSEMTLKSVALKELIPDVKAVKGSLLLPGKAIEAKYAYRNLDLTWRAVLRDGSHYMRTEIELTANKTTKMHAIVPMIYTIDNQGNQQAPVVVGNTRGAVLMSDKIFAGLETPMGINSVESSNGGADLAAFNAKGWNENSFIWKPGKEVPAGIKALGFNEDQIVATRGYLKFYHAGDNCITFTYKGGTHKLNIVGVDVLDMDGKLVDSDYHKGAAGSAHTNNVYTITIPNTDECFMVRYFIETKTETITSHGEISYSHKVAPAEVVFDGVAEDSSTGKKVVRALSGNTLNENESLKDHWTPADWKKLDFDMPFRIGELGYKKEQVRYIEQELNITAVGELSVEFLYKEGKKRLDMAGVALIDANGAEAAYDFHKGYTGTAKDKNVYKFAVPNTGKFKLRYYAADVEGIDSKGDINISLAVKQIIHLPAPKTTDIQGKWSRNVNLEAGKTWNVSAVVGLVAPGQPRRSLLAYVERERAVPWRAYPIYNSWYELNINRNNDRNYDGNMHDYQCVEIVKQWQKHLYEPYGTGIQCFVWDDGWDIYGEWQFNKNFPNGFAEQDRLARQMEAGTGAWLGPVGGYGTSGNYRREYWANKGGMQLSNERYYKVFYKGCTDLMKKYDFRYFKFDGISAQFSSVGPDAGTQGEENAEGIIYAELDMRKVQPDIFFNTSVGTWASPFWFHITDAVWRQENDYGEIGNNSNSRERWITYRDRLVYQNFVQNSPMCPINCLMTHGFILSDFGPVSKDRDYDAIVREMRCAFACGSGMVELYNDFKLMNNIKDNEGNAGALWGELARCIEWQKKNEEVLPDIHWVGGNPWNGSSHEVYGWAAWNGEHAVLTLRNGANEAQTFETTLRKALEIPAYVKGTITLNKGFEQADLEGFAAGQPIDIDAPLTLKLPGSSVFVFDNTVEKVKPNYVVTDVAQINNRTGYTLQSESKNLLVVDPVNGGGLQTTDQTTTNSANEQFAFIRNEVMAEGEYFMYAIGAKKFVTSEGTKMVLTDEPVETVKLLVAEDKASFAIQMGNGSLVTLKKGEAKLEMVGANADNSIVITAVNHKAGLSSARERVDDLYKYERLERDNWKVEASSWGRETPAEMMIDNQLSTYWQNNTAEGTGEQVMPYTLTFDLGKIQKFCSFGYYARLDNESGVCKSYALSISDDNEIWKAVKSGELKFNNRKFVWGDLGKTVEARYVRLTISSNQAGDQLASIAEFYLGDNGDEVTPEMNNLPLFSTEEAPQWYPVYFKRGGAYLEDQGADHKLLTANKRESDAQQWQFIGNEYSFIMKSKSGHYVCFKDERFQTTAEKAKADELAFIQHGNFYLEMKVKGANNCMNQYGGGGANRELGTWNAGDVGNAFQVMPISIPAPTLPVFSDEKTVSWYVLQFKNGKKVIEEQGEGKSVRLAEKTEAKSQVWKLVGNRNHFQIMNPNGNYLVVSNEPETEVGDQAGNNPHPVRLATMAYEPGFKLVASQNESHAPAWEIQSNDASLNGKSFNQHAGTNVGRTIGFWNAGDNNNPLEFVSVTTAIEDVLTKKDSIQSVYNLAGVRMNTNVKQLSKGIYVINGKKVVIK